MGNLPYDVSEDDVREALEALGCAAPSGVRIPLDKETNQPRGFAFVEFEQVAASLGNEGGGRGSWGCSLGAWGHCTLGCVGLQPGPLRRRQPALLSPGAPGGRRRRLRES